MSGVIYCFNTLADSNVIKCGHTQQSLSKRLGGYLGPSKPRMLIFHRAVNDSVHAEQVMLTLMRQCRSLQSRQDLGNEWFEVIADMDLALGHLIEIANIVHMVHADPTPAPPPFKNEPPKTTVPHAQLLSSLRKYLTCMDSYVRNNAPPSAFSSAETLMRNFDASPECPVFSEYLPFGEARLDIIEKRYKVALDEKC